MQRGIAEYLSEDDEDEQYGRSNKRTVSTKNKKSNYEDGNFRVRLPPSFTQQSKLEEEDPQPPAPPPFNHNKILDLPSDVLVMVFSLLEPPTLWAICSATKKLYAFLSSKQSRTIWLASFAGYKVTAPRRFHQRLDPQPYDPIPGRFQFYGFGSHGHHDNFTAFLPEKCNLTEADRRHFELTNELPLAVPPCPDGLAEFAYARFLFSTRCPHCRFGQAGSATAFWEFFIRPCVTCQNSYLISIGDLLLSDRRGGSSQEASTFAEFAQFLAHEPYMLNNHNGVIGDIKSRMLYFKNHFHSTELQLRLTDFLKNKTELSPDEFAQLLHQREEKNKERVLQGRKYQEYFYLRRQYDRYIEVLEKESNARKKQQHRNNLFSELVSEHGVKRSDLEVLFKRNSSFIKKVTEMETLSDIKKSAIVKSILEQVASFQVWTNKNPHWKFSLYFQHFYDYYISHLSFKTYTYALPTLFSADLFLLRSTNPFETLITELPGDGALQSYTVVSVFNSHSAKILDEARFRSLAIREQLVDMLLERKDENLEADPEPEDCESEEHGRWIIGRLKRPDALFRCEVCKTLHDWRSIVLHSCVSMNLAHSSFEVYEKGWSKTRCKPVGFQISRISAPSAIVVLSQKLIAAVETIVTGNEWRYGKYSIPKTHAEAESTGPCTWYFSCSPEICQDHRCDIKSYGYRTRRVSRRTFREMLLHLYSRLEKTKTKAADLPDDAIRVYTGQFEA